MSGANGIAMLLVQALLLLISGTSAEEVEFGQREGDTSVLVDHVHVGVGGPAATTNYVASTDWSSAVVHKDQ